MENKKEYTIVVAESSSILSANVTEMMVNGWTPTGGVAISMVPFQGGYQGIFHQAMVK